VDDAEEEAWYTDTNKKAINNRVSLMITQDLKLNQNDLVFKGYDESLPGHISVNRGFESTDIT